MTSQLNVDTIVDKAGSGGTNVKVGNTSTYVSDGGNVTQNTVEALTKAWFSQMDQSGQAVDVAVGYETIEEMQKVQGLLTIDANTSN